MKNLRAICTVLIAIPCAAIPIAFAWSAISLIGVEPLPCEPPNDPPAICEPEATRVIFEGDTCYLDCRMALPKGGRVNGWCDDRVFRRALGEELFAPLTGWCSI